MRRTRARGEGGQGFVLIRVISGHCHPLQIEQLWEGGGGDKDNVVNKDTRFGNDRQITCTIPYYAKLPGISGGLHPRKTRAKAS